MPFNINDGVSPESAPLTIIGALNALAYQVKSITGGETWKTTPPTSIQTISNLVGGQNTVFQSSGEIGSINDLIQLKNGGSTLKIQGERNNQAVDRYFFNWFPDTDLNSQLIPGGLSFGYNFLNPEVRLFNAGLVFERNSQYVGSVQSLPGRLVLLTTEVGGITFQQYGGNGHHLNWSPYLGLRLNGFNGGALLFEVGENIGTIARNHNPSVAALTVVAASGQADNLVRFSDNLGVTKLAISNDIKLSFPEGSSPTDTVNPIGWIEVKLGGETAYIPAYQ